jgi:putative ABC transport system ATP-binding protein
MVPTVKCDGISKAYGRGATAEPVLRGVNLSLHPGQACALLGPSGSGKTTLLSVLGCLLSPCSGRLHLGGEQVNYGSTGQLVRLRCQRIGFVFQHAQLLPFLSVGENVSLVGRNAGGRHAEVNDRAEALLDRLGVAALRNKHPGQLSGGQRQRVAVARALVHRPAIVLADEPTAALDWERGEAVVRLLVEQAREEGAALLVVTHDTRLVGMFDRVLHMVDGRVREK